MSNEFKMKCKLSNSNVYIKISGEFTRFAAESLSAVILKHYNKVARVFVDAQKLLPCGTEESEHFKREIANGHMPTQQLFFKGEEGFALAANGCRVLITKKKKCQCAGACAKCACVARAQSRGAVLQAAGA